MSEYGAFSELYAPELVRQRREAIARGFRGSARGRRTTRRTLARGLLPSRASRRNFR